MASAHGHSGKTMVGIGFLGALKERGQVIQPFKKGPDYIDPSWLGFAAGRECRNLDCYWMDEDQVCETLVRGTADAEMAYIEGAMGLFDGLDLAGTGSTAQLARIIKAPVILVVDATRMTRSVAPLIQGFINFEKDVIIAGIILNKVASGRHEQTLRAAIDHYCGIPVLGAIPKNAFRPFPERHLGLVPVTEHCSVRDAIAGGVQIANEYLDTPGIIAIANKASFLPIKNNKGVSAPLLRVKIGVFRDKVFSFYYPENIEALTSAGAEIVWLDSINDIKLPAVDGLYIGGGFPEVFVSALVKNSKLRSAIKTAAMAGLPVYGECGGLMYLSRKIILEGNEYPMCGILPFDIVFEKKPQGHGYTLMRSVNGNPFFAEGAYIKGHEYHHSKAVNLESDIRFTYEVIRGQGIDGKWDGVLVRNVFATYNHIHSVANQGWSQNFVSLAAAYHDKASRKKALSQMPTLNGQLFKTKKTS
jgi:cobyrinic acid a,c-diamide synthase